jgi:hypothetical protein
MCCCAAARQAATATSAARPLHSMRASAALLLLALLLAPQQLSCAAASAAALEPVGLVAGASEPASSSGGGWPRRRLLQTLPVCDVSFEELSFSYATADSTTFAANSGMAVGDRVVYRHVGRRPCSDGQWHWLDAVVTTAYVTPLSMCYRYELGAKAGGTDDYFQVRRVHCTHTACSLLLPD